MTDFYTAWHFLCEHPHFFYGGKLRGKNEPGFEERLSVMVVKLDPELDEITGDPVKDVMTQVWLECGPYDDPEGWEASLAQWANYGVPVHDIDLDVGADTFEIAIVLLAQKVLDRFGEYPEYRVCSHCLLNRPAGETDPEAEWFCSASCTTCGEVGFRTEPSEYGVRYISPREYFDCEHWRNRE